ncbi:FAD-binding protein [Lentibacter algarum]|uniref:FAD-binding oxidoreductase n=1 Tax=Lentibacter algarum TaxID=576131 RepID=UPI001C09868D|nr:FAD-linked oxidase C-terminal domain-containing protein [Lentibacter algarum]MBU2982863.1 FAD-binding protein [Lentibacter algarum]
MSIEHAVEKLQVLLGARLSLNNSDLELHGRSETYHAPANPDAVAFPRNTEEVSALVKICADEHCPVIGFGVGTSLEGQTQAPLGGISVDFREMKAIRTLRQEDMDATVEPGLTREELNDELRATGLFFPVDPGANATLGGMAATRASGTTAVRYGTMRDNVLGLEVVLADGRIIRTGTRARKSAAGYDLTALMIGSEGTLGLITALDLKLQGQPEAVTAAICAFESIDAAVSCVIETIQLGLSMARIEFVDTASVAAFNKQSKAGMPEMPHLLLEFHGTETGVSEMAAVFGDIAADHGGLGFEWATKREDRDALWHMRHNAFYAIKQSRPGCLSIVTDICVPISRLADAVNETIADLAASGLSGPILGHVGDGNFHAILLVDPDSPQELNSAKLASERMVKRALAMGGTATGEHGIGIGKLPFMTAEHGDGWEVMGDIKKALDPLNIMNPGKLVPPSN